MENQTVTRKMDHGNRVSGIGASGALLYGLGMFLMQHELDEVA
jgi:hypothetical protein